MNDLRVLWRRIVGFLRDRHSSAADDDARAEFEAHLAMETDELVRRGLSPDEARRRALLNAGGLTAATESVRAARGLPWAESLLTDARYALRVLRSSPAYSAAVVLTLALGIGATAAMFTILNAVILRPLPYPDSDRILSLSIRSEGSDAQVADARSYEVWKSARSLDAIAGIAGGVTEVFDGPAGPTNIVVTYAAEPYFRITGVQPLLGRVFTPEEDRPGAPDVALISEQLWRGQFGSDPDILGRVIRLDSEPVTIIGVMPASYTTPRRSQVWRPYRLTPPTSDGALHYWQVVARMRPDVTVDDVRAELLDLQRRADPQRREHERGMEPVVMTLHERRYGSTRTPLLLLFGAVGVLLLITCANLANLALARAAKRAREFSMRIALGSRPWRLARYVLVECLILSLVGAALGVLLAASTVGWFVRISPASVANAEGIVVNMTVLLFALGVAVTSSVLFGLVPALTAARARIADSLTVGGSRTATGQHLVRRGLVVFELATALVLVIGAGLLARSFWAVTRIDMGFDASNVLVANISLPFRQHTPESAAAFWAQLTTRADALPGAASVSRSDGFPTFGARSSVQHSSPDGTPGPRFLLVGVTSSYFGTMRTRIVEGQGIGPDDRDVAVISAELATALYPGESAVGKLLGIGGRQARIAGVTGDVRWNDLEAAPAMVAFVPFSRNTSSYYQWLAVRHSGEPAPLITALTAIVRDLEPAMPPPTFQTMEEMVAEESAPRKFVLVLLGGFAMLAALLAVIGLYGVLSYLAAERTREIGIRVALGADARRVTGFLVGKGAVLIAVGLAIGLATAGAAVRLLESMVYGLSVHDARTFTAAAVTLGAAALVASWLPARRASRVDPVIALRDS